MDVKKKELIGNFFRSGTLYTQETIRVNDHDFPSYAEGKVIPHGLYDLNRNKGYITLGGCPRTRIETKMPEIL